MTAKPATPRMISFLFVLINVVIPVLSQVPPGAPSINGPDVIVRGQTIVLECTSTGGSPTPTVKWFKDNTEITDGISSSTSGSTVTTTYTFVATLNDHYEVFECQADNGVLQNPLKITKFVFVHYTPDVPILNGPTSLVADTPGTWTCTSANGYPAGTMTIKNANTGTTFQAPAYSVTTTAVNGGRSFTVVGTLNWSPALSNNNNQLCCEVAHPTTIQTPQSVCITLAVKAPLAVNAPITSYTPTIGDPVTLQCVVTSGTATSITWFKGSTQLTIATNSRYSNGDVSNPSLTISGVQQSDGGDYTCRASDGSVTVSTDNINVNPQGTPPVVTIPVNSYQQTVGNSITIACQVSSPNSALQSVQWTFTNQNGQVTDPVVITSPKYSGSTTLNPSLTINNVQFSDEGTYRCRATNLIGTTNSADTAFLDVQGTPPVLSITPDTYSAVYGSQLTINCVVTSANPSVTNIYWTRESGGTSFRINNGDTGYQGSTPQTPSLTINFVIPAQHTGTYRCHGTNVVDTGSSNQAAVTITGGLLTINQSPASANVLRGSSTTINCIVSGTPTASNIIWLFTPTGGSQGVLNKQLNKHTGGTTTTPSLTISNFQSSDAGTYRCQAVNAAGTATSTTSTVLTYMEQLSINISPSDGTAIVGDAAYTITCQITGVPSATSTSWYRVPINGGSQTTINSGNKYNINANSNNPTLTITNIVEGDESDYFCTATNLAGTRTSTRSRLIVNGDVNNIAISPASANVIQGNNQPITCTVTGVPNPTGIRWYFTPSGSSTRQQLFISSSNGKYTGGTVSNPSITVTNFQSGDAGAYQCEAINAAGTATSTNSVLSYLGILSVTVQPSTQQATIGDASVTIQCTIQGSPQATSWEWTKTPSGGNAVVIAQGTNNGKLQVASSASNPNLIIYNLQSSDAAVYRCRANNGAGQITSGPSTLTVQGTLPTISVEPSQLTATVGDSSVQFQCFVTAVPQASSWYWTFQPANGGQTQTISQGTNDLNYMIDNSPSNPHLTIKNIASEEAGQYYCHATNAVGSQQSSAGTLIVTGAILTVGISPPAANVVRGNSQQVLCIISGTPSATQIRWFFTANGGTAQLLSISTSNGKYSGGTVGTPHLTITNFQSNDAGSYRCEAVNAAGTGTSTNSVLTYVEILSISTSPSDGTAIYGDASYTIQCTITGTPQATTWSWTRRPLNGGLTSATAITSGAKYSIANSATSPHLTINNIVEDDEKDYFCHATNVAGDASSPTRARLIVNGGLLTVSISPPSVQVLKGDSQTIQCSVTGIPAASNIIWYFTPSGSNQEQTLSLTIGKYSGGTTTTPSLTINNFQTTDAGTYVCAAENAVGTARSSTSTLTFMEQLTINVSPPDGTAIYGDASYTIQCTISGVPTATGFGWYRRPVNSNADLSQIFQSTKYSIVNSPTAPHLTINNIVEEDEQDYFCRATNLAGTQLSTRARLIVNGDLLTVSVSPASANVMIGTSQQITCTITGIPPVTLVTWRFTSSNGGAPTNINVATSNGKYTGGSTATPHLTVTNFQQSDSGAYVCSATNAVGQASSTASVLTFVQPLSITVSPPDSTREYGTASFEIDCIISGSPAATSWSWSSRPIDGSVDTAVNIAAGTKYSIANSNTRPKLTIFNIVEADERDYYCHATNVVGDKTSSRARLIVTGDLLTVTISPATKNVVRGDTQIITCTVTGSPIVQTISWTKDGANIDISGGGTKYSGGTPGNPSLTVINFQQADAGVYVCTATNAVGSKSSTTSTLSYIENLSLQVTPSQGTAVLGAATFVFSCTITGTPQATTWRWIKNPGQTNAETITKGTNSNKYLVMESSSNPSLTIKNIAQSDDASYRCEATNSAGTRQSATARLIVTGQLPAISVNPLQQFPQYGASSVTITCTVSASPSADTVGWRKISVDSSSTTNIDAPNSNGKYSVASSLTNPDLTINNVIFSDDANYQCYATNAVGTGNSALARIDVQGSLPQVSIPQSSYTAVFGNDITIPCQISGANPQVTAVAWFKVNNQITTSINVNDALSYSGGTVSNPALTIKSVNSADGGFYRCTATNQVGTGQSSNTQLQIQGGLLTVTVPTSTYSVLLGNNINLQCTVTGLPAATDVYWEKRGATNNFVRVNPANNNRYSGGNLNTPTLSISSAQFSDEGVYRCIGVNAAGSANSIETNLDVTGTPPTVTLTSTQFPVIVGNDIVLGCNVISNPTHTEVYWVFTNNAGQATTITSSTNTVKYGGVTIQSPSLVLRNADFSDIGKYVCYAKNSIGTGNSEEATLEVAGQPPTVTVPIPSTSVDFGNSVTLTCTVTANPPHTVVYWRKLRNGITTDINVANSNNKYSGSTVANPSLVINNAQLDDQGSYTCYAQNSVGTGQSTPTALTVTGNIPYVRIQQSQYTVNYGDQVTLGCVVTADPTHTRVYWQKIKNNQVTTIDSAVITNNARYSGSTVGTPSLTISNVNLDDAAFYICFAENTVGVGQSSQTTVVVSGSVPQVAILSNSYLVEVGNTRTLQCSIITANPAITSVSWQKIVNGVAQDVDVAGTARFSGSTVTTPSLTINNAQFSDEGNYICRATNAVGTGASAQSYLDVYGNVPVVTVPQTQFEFNFGESATLTCTVSANPTETRVYWKKLMTNGQLQEVDMTSAKYSGSIVGSPSLVIAQINKNDQAFYQCFADNNVGTGSSSQTFLRVKGDIPVVSVPTTHSFTLGTTATLQCSVTASPLHTRVYWAKLNAQNQPVNIDMGTNNNNKYQGSTVSNPSLTILNTVAADSGRYVCYAVNIVGTGQSGTTTLDITGAIPNVNIPQDQYGAQINTQVTLACTVSASPAETSIYWTKQVGSGQEVTIDKTNTAKYQGQTVNSPSLVILNADFSDNARYYCYATNDVGTGKSNPTTLTVTGTVPNVQIPLPSYSVNYAGTGTIPCTVSAAPSAQSVQWKKIVNGVEQNIDLSSSKYSGSTVQSPALIINNAVTSDEAFYICTATNSVGTGRSSQTYLDVVGAPPTVTIGSNTYTVQKNQNIELVCTINANPQAQSVQWYRFDGGVQSALRTVTGKYNTPTLASPNLMINNADEQDRGYYICTATNIVGTGTSTSTFLDVTGNIPIVTIALTQYNGNFGGQVTLGCTVVANPSATEVYWVKTSGNSNTEIRTATNKYSFSLNSPSLTITNLQQEDEANYRCVAVNPIGTGQSQTTFLDMLGSVPQVTVSAQPVDTNIGGSATIVCNIQANPMHTNVYWQKLDGNNNPTTINIDNTKYSGSTVNNPSLTINNAQLSDRANYVCFATNGVGTGQSGPAYLNVIGNPPLVNIPLPSYTVQWGVEINIVCTITANPQYTAVAWKKIQNGVETTIDVTNSNKYEGGVVGSPSLKIKMANRNTDQAFYECSATNSVGTGTSSRTFLTVSGNIPLVSIPTNYQVEVGQSVVVVCNIDANPIHTSVQWQRRSASGTLTNVDVSNQNKYQNGNVNNPSLTILSATTDDEGYYICTATNAVGTGSSSDRYVDVTGNILQVNVPQPVYNVNYGETIQLVCTVTGSPSATEVYWISVKQGQSTEIRASSMDSAKYSGATLNNPSLTILNANINDGAVYKCYARNIVGLGESQQTQLNVIGSKPTVTVGSPTYSVNLGNAITLQCTVIATPSAQTVRWNKVDSNGNSVPINVAANPAKYSGATLAIPSLTILNAQNSDASAYTCQATNPVGTTVSSQTALTVIGNIPQVQITQAQYSFIFGENALLECIVTANPLHTAVFWKKIVNGQPVDLPTDGRFGTPTVGNPSLTISGVVTGDIGNYKCYATNSVGTGESAQTYLNVVGTAPVVNVASPQYSVNIANTITLQCSVQANPIHTSVKWQRVDASGNAVDVDMTNSRYSGSSVNSPSLVISNTVKADEGRYVCLATNLVGTGQSQQTYLTVVGSIPSVTVPVPSYSVNTGSSVTIECTYSANPQATLVRWEKTSSGNTVQIGDTAASNKYGGSTLSSPSLIIYNAAESDEGNYRCKVSNAVGTGISAQSAALDVIGNVPIVTVPTGAYTVDVGDPITLTCQVTSNPAHTVVYWQKVTGGQTTNIDTTLPKYSGSTPGSPSLVINNSAFTDSGTYYCFATNAVGTGQSTQVVLAVAGTTPSVSLTNPNVQANYGSSVTLGCVVSANPAATSVYWQKIVGNNAPITIDMSNTAKYTGATVANPSLQINNLNTNDQAKYICFAANSVGTGQSTQGTLTVVGSPPVVTMPEPSYTINIGNSITIACSITSNPAHTSVYWTRRIGNNQEEQISTTGQSSSKYSGSTVNSPSLVIYNVQFSDAGQYNCHATNIVGTGQASTPTNLNVVGNVPTVTASIPSSARIGTSVTIVCTVDANPAATQIIWQFVTNNAPSNIDISGNSRFSGGDVTDPNLTINPVRESDEGTYRCQAINSEGTGTSNTVYLDTTGDPPINVAVTPNPLTVTEGDRITAVCSAQGTPAPSYEWRKFGSATVIATGATLSIANAVEDDATSYTCRAYNSFGSNEASLNVNVQYRPKVEITNHPISGKLAQSATIQCTFKSNPFASNVQWKKVVGGIETNINIDGNKYQGGTLTSPSLTIFNLAASDQADYFCTATNSVGTGRSNRGSLTVDMRTSPMGIQIFPGQITVLEGNDFSIYCNATANPAPTYEWYHKDVRVGTGQTFNLQNSNWTKHDGLYTCKAENEIGYQEATIDVDVKYPPVSAVTQNTFYPVLNSPITLTCNTKANPSAISWKWFQNGFEIVGQNEKTLPIAMKESDVGQYHCIAYNEVGQSPSIFFSVQIYASTTPGPTTVTTVTAGPDTGESVAGAGGLTGGEIAAICLGILFFVLLLIVLIACCILQGCCAWCCAAGAGEKDRRVTPDQKVAIPQFYEVPTVVTREPSLISKRDVSLHMAPIYSGRPSNEYEITKYRVVRPEYEVDERYVTTAAARPYYLPAIEYTYDEEERRRRRRKKKRSRRHDELRGDEQIVLEERVVDDGFRTGTRYSDVEVEEVVTGPVYRFDPE